MLELGGGAEEEGCRAQWAATFQNPGVTAPHPAPWQVQPPSSQNPSSRSGPRPLKRRGLEKVRVTSPIRHLSDAQGLSSGFWGGLWTFTAALTHPF